MDLRPHIRKFASSKALTRKGPPFPADAAWGWITVEFRSKKPREVMQFMAWMWRGGVYDLEFIKSCAVRAREGRIRDPYAYFAKDGDAVQSGLSQKAIREAEGDNNLRKKDLEEWLRK